MDFDEYVPELIKKQRLIQQIRQIKAKYDQQREENKEKLDQLKEIRNELNNVKIRKEKNNSELQ